MLSPVGFKFLITYGGPSDVAMLTIDSYYSTVLKLLLLFGVSFEMPVLIVLLGYLGVVDAPALRRQRKPAILGITVLSAMFARPTPSRCSFSWLRSSSCTRARSTS